MDDGKRDILQRDSIVLLYLPSLFMMVQNFSSLCNQPYHFIIKTGAENISTTEKKTA